MWGRASARPGRAEARPHMVQACGERNIRCFGSNKNQNDLTPDIILAPHVYWLGRNEGIVSLVWNDRPEVDFRTGDRSRGGEGGESDSERQNPGTTREVLELRRAIHRRGHPGR